ncbi:MAG: bifunctional transaldolase/phosoglucose isomerase [Gemmatimonadales bacterium]|nr:bifunctional transaldolase/phosoglucose isomerase [Gemmatimonadales bacterium]NIN12831.1 bifunctional transaldolase/phosoglucose isomerase [Gemmatimonadales bacterium]NIN48759.1 bifunctional transaldolase/phosoglucose isomerase [Gemmatimonadales bacterium]NIP06223.1 bifunctional transaldolase/phosoglucose isomerase [Gemmatimonadales bacterium]NIR01408.1 bifunctional transaldolase/phosoglucose isomerase [Gemmatimonadales bacterium]
MNPLKVLQQQGQSVWLDYIRRTLMTSGELARLVEEDGLRGVTSNPTIFEKALAGSDDYDEALGSMLFDDRHADPQALYEALAIEDIRMACDIVRPVYEETLGADGFVSLEVSPRLAHHTAGTVADARRLWRAVDRPNLMVKVPATEEGIPAIETLIAECINVNVTLMFSLSHYDAVAQAYLRGLKRSSDPGRVASVASFFVSRVDTAVDRALDQLGTPEARALQGSIAVANAKRAYQRFLEIFRGESFAALRNRGGRPQRVLWASTGTRNPAYSDVLYVEELIGADTVNTMPPATLNAFRDHGQVRPSLEQGVEEAEASLAKLAELGVDLEAITEQLQRHGVAAFAGSFEKLVTALEEKRKVLLAAQQDRQQLSLGTYQEAVNARVRELHHAHVCRRLWEKDPTIWSATPAPELTDRLGWLALPELMHEQLDEVQRFAAGVREEGLPHVVLLGMGGSSLAPEVFASTFGSAPGWPDLIVLDSTHPAAVHAVERRIDPSETLFVVSSKSGTTLETLSLFRTFWDRVGGSVDDPGRRFVAITDPETPLERLARDRGFRKVFRAPKDVGGRYSALSVFGLVPAALTGIDVHLLLDRAWTMAEAGAFCVAEASSPGLVLGSALGELAQAGRDKVTFFTSSALASFPAWLEQLIAESTGKDGKGILPVEAEAATSPDVYGADRAFVLFTLEGDEDAELESRLTALEAAGHPVVRTRLDQKADLAQEMFRWEVAVAVASAVLGIHPFNQPDVQLAKDLARQAMAAGAQARGETGGEGRAEASADQPDGLVEQAADWLGRVKPGDYVALQAYLAPTLETADALQEIRIALRDRLRIATTLGYGPRFLHSTGQLHKGGPNTGLFLQLVDEPGEDFAVPETDYTFGALIRAQARGDYGALLQRGRRVLRVNLGSDVAAGLARLQEVLR